MQKESRIHKVATLSVTSDTLLKDGNSTEFYFILGHTSHAQIQHTFGSSAINFFRSFSSLRRLQPLLKYRCGLFALCCNY